MNKGYPLNLRRYRLVRKKDNKYHPAYSHNHVEKEAQLFAGRSKVLSRIAATSIHTENHITNVTNKESKLCNIHGTILLYFTSQDKVLKNCSLIYATITKSPIRAYNTINSDTNAFSEFYANSSITAEQLRADHYDSVASKWNSMKLIAGVS